MVSSKIKVTGILLILMLFVMCQCQRGRGGGSSGRSSSSFSSSSYRSSSPFRSYSTYGSGTQHPAQAIAIVVGTVCIIFCCIGFAVSDWRSIFRSLFNKQNNTQLLDAEFERLKTVKNNVSTIIMKKKYYEQIKNQFIQIMSAQQSIFQYTQNGQSTRIYNTKVKQFPEGEFIDRIQLSGCDEVGPWTGRGYFLASVQGPYVWWMKDYNDKQAAGQVGDSQFLIYESTSYYQGKWQGRWYYEGDQNDQIYSGSWTLHDPSNEFVIDCSANGESPRKWNPFDVLAGKISPSQL